jgi:hypothetical protein
MNTTYKQPIDRLKRHMAEYQPQLNSPLKPLTFSKQLVQTPMSSVIP